MLKELKLKIIKKSIQMLRDLDDYDLKKQVLTEAIKELYCVISSDEILRQEPKGVIVYKGRPLSGLEIAKLKEEALFIKNMKLWHMIQQDIKYVLGKKMWEECRTKEDLIWGMLATYLNDIINTRIKAL